MSTPVAAVSADTWLATLREVAKQAQQVAAEEAPAGPAITVATSDWVEVPAPHPPPLEAEESTLWPEQQWQIAFEILVS